MRGMKKKVFIFVFASCLSMALSAFAKDMDVVCFDKDAVPCFKGHLQPKALSISATENIAIPKEALDPKGGHIQGIAIGDDGSVYVSQMTQLTKLDKSGKAVGTRKVINHTGDVTWWNGELYTAVAVQPNNKEGRIEVFDKDLNLVRSMVIDRAIDGIACLDGVLYVGMGAKVQPSKNAHRVNILGRFDAKTLQEIAPRQDFDYGYETRYGFQDVASDGKFLYATFYAVKGAPRMAIFDKDGKIVGVGNDGSNNGFDFLPDRSGILVQQNGVVSVKPLPSIRNGK